MQSFQGVFCFCKVFKGSFLFLQSFQGVFCFCKVFKEFSVFAKFSRSFLFLQRFLVFWRRNIEFLMRRPFSTSDGILFQIVGSAKEAVSIPYLTVRTLQYLNLVSFLSEYGFPTVRKIFFITSGTTFSILKFRQPIFCRLV